MSFSICSPCCLSNSGLLTRRAMPRGRGVGAPGSSVAARTSAVSVAHERRTANYPPSMWDGELIQSLKIDSTETDELTHSEMLEEVKHYLLETERGIGDQLQLVDTLRQLGVSYRLEKEINDVLSSIYRSIDEVVRVTKDDLFATSLLFRLLREHGFHVSQDLFNNFKEENGSLKAHLRDDVKGVLGLYEASFLAIEGETLMDEARIFATDCLTNHNRSGFGLEPTMKERVAYALDLPLHWRMQRLHTRWFIDQYDTEEAMVPALLQFAKLDFNMVQSIHRRELKQLSRWWKDLGLGERLPFARDRLVENYLWTVGCAFDPKLCRTREATAKANCFITTIDDLYDVYGTLDELELFTDAIERWDASSISRLPDYMKICFMALHNTTNDTSYKAMKLKGINVLPYIKKAWVDICKAFFVEAKWYHEGYKPTLKEYLDNGCISVSGHIALTTAYCMSTDLQNGTLSSIKPQQVTYIVPGIEGFDYADIPSFIHKTQNLLDPTMLEYAWAELLEKGKSVTAEELAEIMYGGKEPLECYCAHLLLSNDDIYFNEIECRGSGTVYEPRPIVQVQELAHRKQVKEESEKELQEFVHLLKSAKAMPLQSKPPKGSWKAGEKVELWIKSLEAYAIDACKNEEQKKTAGNILKGVGLSKTSDDAVNLLIDIGYFPVHINLDLLKFNVRTEHGDEVLLVAEDLLAQSSELADVHRNDLTFLKVYAIDVDEADELDDALSAERLQDGRIRVWIHVADPTCLVEPHSIIDREAMRRGTSIFLPTATFPMFPEKLAMEAMSLQQGRLCKAVSVAVTLHHDGSIAEYTIDSSIIRPTYMLTYESATELLHLNLEEETELRILSEAASLRLQWRRSQGAIDTTMIEPRIKVANPDDPEPFISLYVEDQSDLAMRLVSEMMILCGEVIATFGSHNNIPLPYRGQPQSNISASAFSHLPEGPVRSSAYVKIMRAAEMDFNKPIRHGILGIPGYVQFTSPIRRYSDLLAHYQIKAFLKKEPLPFSSGELAGMTSLVNMHVKVARRLHNSSLRYWLLEYMRRQPRERKFRALILRFIKDRVAALLLVEVGIQASATVSVGNQIGDELEVVVEEAHPRDDILSLKEVQVNQEVLQVNQEVILGGGI